jgi:hypothetical protein
MPWRQRKRRVRPGEERRVAKPKVDPAHKKPEKDLLRPLTEEHIAIENKFPDTLTFAAIAQAAGMHTSQTECMRRAIRGTCMLCDQAPHKHEPKMCHKVPFHKRKDIQSVTRARLTLPNDGARGHQLRWSQTRSHKTCPHPCLHHPLPSWQKLKNIQLGACNIGVTC